VNKTHNIMFYNQNMANQKRIRQVSTIISMKAQKHKCVIKLRFACRECREID
jgi:hypothetical protein